MLPLMTATLGLGPVGIQNKRIQIAMRALGDRGARTIEVLQAEKVYLARGVSGDEGGRVGCHVRGAKPPFRRETREATAGREVPQAEGHVTSRDGASPIGGQGHGVDPTRVSFEDAALAALEIPDSEGVVRTP